MSSPYEKALQAGYSQEEINTFLSQKNPKYKKALDAGYSPEEITSYLQNQPSKESWMGSLNRNIVRGGARAAETVLGAPRAFGEFGESIVPEKAIGNLAGKVGLREPVEKGFEIAKKYAPYKLFPKSEDVRRDITSNLFGKGLEPKNEWEKEADDLVSDFTALALPMPGAKFKVLKPAMLALGGAIAGQGVKQLGGSEKQQAYAKLGTILAGSLINPKSAENLKNDLYKKARESRPNDAKVKGAKLNKDAANLENKFKIGGIADSDKPALEKLKDVKKEIKNGDITIESLENLKIKINEALAGIYKTLEGNKPGIKRARSNLNQVSNIVDDALKDYGKTNPQWESFYRPANEVHGAIAQSKRVRNLIERIGKKHGKHAILPALGIGHFGGPAALGNIALAGGAGGIALGAGEIIARVMKSKTLRRHYTNLINGALKDDAAVVASNLSKLEEELQK